ncbi:MAG: hypothetical protein RL122_259 [Pseudomonadota bacterium]|jgi:hypothetical protein
MPIDQSMKSISHFSLKLIEILCIFKPKRFLDFTLSVLGADYL